MALKDHLGLFPIDLLVLPRDGKPWKNHGKTMEKPWKTMKNHGINN